MKKISLLITGLMFLSITSIFSQIYVDSNATGADDGSSWANAYNYLQDALVSAVDGDSIWIAKGTYLPDEGAGQTNDDLSSVFIIPSGVAVFGGFAGGEAQLSDRDWEANETVLSGDIDNTPDDKEGNAHHVVKMIHVNNKTILDGLIIEKGSADDGFSMDDGYASGIYNYNSEAQILNCIIRDNYCHMFGAGIYNDSASYVLIDNCTITNNECGSRGGAGIYNNGEDTCNVTILNSVISNNISDWFGGGISNAYCSPTITNCIISGNQAKYGGGIYNKGDDQGKCNPVITNCVISGNLGTSYGGGFYCKADNDNKDYSMPEIINCAIVGNKASGYGGGGFALYHTNLKCTNTIIGGNSADFSDEIYTYFSSYEFAYCNIKGCGGSSDWQLFLSGDLGNNIDADPLFLNQTNPDNAPTSKGNLHLYLTSPCLDTADNAANAESNDLDGDTRIQNTTIDMGPYEGGEDYAAPVTQATNINYNTLEAPEIILNWTTGSAGKSCVFVKQGNTGTPAPVDDTEYLADSEFGSGDEIGTSGWFCVYSGTDHSFKLSGLSPLTEYRIMVCEYNGNSGLGIYKYNTATAAGNPLNISTEINITRFYVDSAVAASGTGESWAESFKTLQEAINQTTPGDSIWVAEGTYYPTEDITGNTNPSNNRDKTFYIARDIKIFGGFSGSENNLNDRDLYANETILSGDLDMDGNVDNGNAYHVVYFEYVGKETALDGFTVMRGNANGGGDDNMGGGIYNNAYGLGNSSSPQIKNCKIIGNYARYGGGIGDEAYDGGESYMYIVNCVITGNETDQRGGGIYFRYSTDPVVLNTTISGNYSDWDGGGIYNIGSNSLYIYNSILWNNRADHVENNIGGHAYFSHCNVQNSGGSSSWDGGFGSDLGGNVDAVPFFVNQPDYNDVPTIKGDVHLYDGSPCLEAGNDTINPEPYDPDGEARIQDTHIEIGAYEGDEGTIPPSVQSKNIKFEYTLAPAMDIYWTPGDGLSHIVFMKKGNTGQANPVDNTTYSANAKFGEGDEINSSGWYCVYKGTDTSFSVEGLQQDTTYSIMVCEVNGGAGSETYLTTTATENPANQVMGKNLTRIYVDGSAGAGGTGESWANSFNTIHHALHEASTGDFIWVKEGTYLPGEDMSGDTTPADNRTKMYYIPGNSIKLFGGFDGTENTLAERDLSTGHTILDGDLNQDDENSGDYSENAYHVVYFDKADSLTTLDGFTIIRGNADNYADGHYQGGGIHNNGSGAGNSSNPIVRNCFIKASRAKYGGGIFNNGYEGKANPTFINCVISGNIAGGTIERGGGMYNNAEDGICNPLIINCTFSGNKARSGGGIYNFQNPGAECKPFFMNTIVWGNFATQTDDEINNGSNAEPSFTHCNIRGGLFSGQGDGTNVDIDPLFADQPDTANAPTTEGDLHIDTCSPVINMGIDSLAITEDIEGNIHEMNPEMGAFEQTGNTPPSFDVVDDTVYLDALGTASIIEENLLDNVTDDCGTIADTVFTGQSNYSCGDAGSTFTINITIKDEMGNSNNKTADVLVMDTITPSFSSNSDTIYLDASGNAKIKAENIINGVSDNCNIADTTISQSSFNCSDLGNQTADITIRDDAGNPSIRQSVITIMDTIKPIALTKNISVQLGADDETDITANDVNNGSYDNCSVDSMYLDTSYFNDNDLGDNIVLLTVIDQNGNTDTAYAVVTVDKTTKIRNILAEGISIYPNPTEGILYIAKKEINKYNIKIYNVLGEMIYENKQMIKRQIDLSHQADGIYFIHIFNNEKSDIFKIKKQSN